MRFAPSFAAAAILCSSPAAAQTIRSQVNFEYGRSEIVAWSADGIRTAVAAVRACPRSAVVHVTGHTDARESSEALNEGVDEERSEATRQALIAQGVSGDSISLREVGATQPAFPTSAGVSDPRNRRATIEVICS